MRCSVCHKDAPGTKPWYALMRHILSKHPGVVPPRIECSICSECVYMLFDLSLFACVSCSYVLFMYYKQCSVELYAVVEKGFVKEYDLEKHIPVHNTHRPFMCNVCGDAFKSELRLKEHGIMLHGQGTEEQRSVSTS